MNSQTYSILKVILAAMFLICLADMPYGYYQLVRFVGMVVFFVIAYDAYKREGIGFAVFWGASALLINPFFKIYLGRTLWNIVDVIWAIALVASIWMDKQDSTSK